MRRGICSLQKYIKDKLLYLEGANFIIDFCVKNYITCTNKNKNFLIRETSGQIITTRNKDILQI